MPPPPQPNRRSLYAAWVIALVGAAFIAVSVTLMTAAHGAAEIASAGVCDALGLYSMVLGLVIASRRPANVVGPLLVAVGLAPIYIGFGTVADYVTSHQPGELPASPVMVAAIQGLWMWLFVPAAMLMLFFPDGRLPGRRWRIAAIGLIVVPSIFEVAAALDPSPFPVPFERVRHPFHVPTSFFDHVVNPIGIALLPTFLGLLIAAAAAMVVRYRRSNDAVRRAQVKWFALGTMLLPATLLAAWVSLLIPGHPDLVLIGFVLTFLAITTATMVGVLRHDLYDVDRALSGAVTYGAVTFVVLGIYTLMSFFGGLLLGRGSTVAAAAATAVCAAALAPLRRRLQRSVDGRLYPARRAVLAAIEDLRELTHIGRAQPEQLESTLQAALRDPDLRVGFRLPGRAGLVDATGAEMPEDGGPTIGVCVGTEEIGVLIRGRVGSRELLREVADAVSLIVEVVRLRIEVARALRDVESSRARLLSAGYQERRRLERDLHDGAQQRLVSLGMGLRLAQRHLGDGTVDVDGLIDQSVAELSTAVAELRQIANGLRPSSLDDGLGAALSALAASLPVPVSLDVCPEPVPDDLATTAYFVASEAVANAIKHASASTIGVSLARSDGHWKLSVSDDGNGGASVRPGAGLAGLTDRVAAAGGALRVESRRGRGTLIEATLPCA